MGLESTWSCDPDRSYWEVLGILRAKGYPVIVSTWYNDPMEELGEGLRLLNDDRGVMEMHEITKVHGEVHLYVLQPMSQPDTGRNGHHSGHGPRTDSEESVDQNRPNQPNEPIEMNLGQTPWLSLL